MPTLAFLQGWDSKAASRLGFFSDACVGPALRPGHDREGPDFHRLLQGCGLNYSEFLLLALWVIGANMRCKFFVALQLEVAHHFIERCPGGRTRGLEPPVTFGATKTPKTLLLNPYQLPVHGHLCRCAPALSDRMPSTCLPSRDETFSFHSGVLPDCNRTPSSSLAGGGRCMERWAKLTRANLDGLSGILHTWKSFVRRERLTLGAWFEVKPNRFK